MKLIYTSKKHLVNGNLPRVEIPLPTLVRSLVICTGEGRGVVRSPGGASGPLAELLDLTLVVTGGDGSVQCGGLDTLLNPSDNGIHVVLGIRSGLIGVGSAVGGTWNQVKLVEVAQFGSVAGAGVREHGLTHSLVIAN